VPRVRTRALRVGTLLRRVLLSSSLLLFLRRFAIAMLAVVVLAGAGFVSGKAYGKREFGKSHVVNIPKGILAKVKPGEPANYLLIGSDVRPADETPQEAQAYGTEKTAGGARSDVMMVLHVDPVGNTGMLVSFPRDLVLKVPGHGRKQLNAAYGLGGPALVIQTLQQDFQPLRINHYLEVDFRGFKQIVNAIGHIRLWFPTPAHDPFTGLNVDRSGCVSVDGDQALAYARSREYFVPKDLQNPAPWVWDYPNQKGGQGWVKTGSDLDRIPRQQYFLRTISQAAIGKTGSNLLKISNLLDAVFKNLTHDQTLKYEELTSLAYTFRDLNPARINMSTLPVIPDPGDPNRVVAKYPDTIGVVTALTNFTPPKASLPKPLRAGQVTLRVVNGSGVKGAATDALAAFTAAGFKSTGPATDADRSDYETEVRYAPGKFRQGFTVALAVGTVRLVQATSASQTRGGDVLLIVGRDYASIKHHFELVPHKAGAAPTSTASTSTTVAAPTTTTTTTTVPRQTADTRFLPLDPKTGGALVGCPK